MKLFSFAFLFMACLARYPINHSYGAKNETLFTGCTKAVAEEIPVLCYHNITRDGKREGPLWIDESRFNDQLKMLFDSGYHCILPEQLYEHLTKGLPLPAKPIMLSFDDSHESHFSIAAPVLSRYGFKGVFFIMTVCLDKKGYLSSAQVKALSDSGHLIGCHTYDHRPVTAIEGGGWDQQINKSRRVLERITGKPVEFFAYPYGTWNDPAIHELKSYGMKAAFQLTGSMSKKDPLFTIRRLMVSGKWAPDKLDREINNLISVINPVATSHFFHPLQRDKFVVTNISYEEDITCF